MSSYPLPIVIHKYVPGKPTKAVGSCLAAHLKYNQYRALGEQETRQDRSLFSAENDHVNRKDAVHDVMNHTSRNVNYHKLILSPGEHEHIDDFQQWTREVMHDLEERKGVHLHWYAVVHAHQREHTNEPHVHLVLAGAGEDLESGKIQAIRIEKTDYAFLRQQGREHSNFTFYQEQERLLHLLNEEDKTPLEYRIDRDLERSF